MKKNLWKEKNILRVRLRFEFSTFTPTSCVILDMLLNTTYFLLLSEGKSVGFLTKYKCSFANETFHFSILGIQEGCTSQIMWLHSDQLNIGINEDCHLNACPVRHTFLHSLFPCASTRYKESNKETGISTRRDDRTMRIWKHGSLNASVWCDFLNPAMLMCMGPQCEQEKIIDYIKLTKAFELLTTNRISWSWRWNAATIRKFWVQ